MSLNETLLAIDGVLGPQLTRFLAEDVTLCDVFGRGRYEGRDPVAARLALHLDFLETAYRDRVRLTIDVGRGVAEWVVRGFRHDSGDEVTLPVACVFEVADGLVRHVRMYAEDKDRPNAASVAALTVRELEVARLVATGLTNREVAEHLVVSARTIDYHLRNAFMKLGVRSRTELAAVILSHR